MEKIKAMFQTTKTSDALLKMVDFPTHPMNPMAFSERFINDISPLVRLKIPVVS